MLFQFMPVDFSSRTCCIMLSQHRATAWSLPRTGVRVNVGGRPHGGVAEARGDDCEVYAVGRQEARVWVYRRTWRLTSHGKRGRSKLRHSTMQPRETASVCANRGQTWRDGWISFPRSLLLGPS
jgi:hypothetical protein